MKSRTYGEKIELDDEKVRGFWSQRANKYNEEHPYVSVKFSDRNPSVSEMWDRIEKETLIPKLGIDGSSYVLDIGCGIGRLAETVLEDCRYYLGVDYSDELIKIAKKRIKSEREFDFVQIAFQEIDGHLELFKNIGKYNKVIIAGVFLFMNDEDIRKSVTNLLKFVSPSCTIYIANSIAHEKRLTLSDWESSDFDETYYAIYRTIDEYEDLFSELTGHGFVKQEMECFLKNDAQYSETDKYYFIYRR